MHSSRPDAIYEFGCFRLEVRERRLVCEGRPIPLTGKAFETLRVLVERHGSLVSKRELMDAVWPETAVEENNLDRNISALRKALGETADTRRYIETVPRVGYRFIAPLRTPVGPAAIREAVAPVSTHTLDLSAIAVLPFADMSPDRDQDYLCEGFAEELINALTHVDGLRVVSRTASFQFRGPGADVREVGRRLNVGALLEGSVRKADDRLRVTVQLIETGSGYHRWSKRFDRTPDDLFAIQDEIAENVAASLRGIDLTGREKALSNPPIANRSGKPRTGAEAYEFYLRGRHYLHLMTQSDLKTSSEMFERAIGLDAGYGPAWGCLAAVRATLYEWFGACEEDLEGAELASQQALQVAPHLPEAHAARGFVLSLFRRYEEAAQAFEDAIRLNPAFFEAYYYFARACFANGQIERSAGLFRRAAEVRPEDFQSCMLLGQSLRMLGRMEESETATREGIQRAERALALNPADGRALSLGSGALFHDGQIARAIEWSQRSLELHSDDVCVLVNAACLQAKLRRKEQALELLERVFAKGWGKRDWIEHDPDYDILRDDPRFQNLLANLK